MRAILLLLCLLWAGCGDPMDGRDAATDAADAFAPFDGGSIDGGVADGGWDGGPDAPTRYASGRTHSPITPYVAENIRMIFSRGSGLRDDVFAKVGDSITVSNAFMHCFDDGAVDLDGRDLQSTIDWFGIGDAGGSSPFSRSSIAAEVGWHAARALEGAPNPVQREIAAIQPAYAIVMYGTNDIGFRDLETFADNVLTITDLLLEDGIVPILSSIPARVDMPSVDANVPRWNMTVRALAQARQIPFMDYHLAMQGLPNRGLGGDGVHPSASGNSCDFTATGLTQGYAIRNLLAIEALDRIRSTIEGEMLDPEGPPASVGAGSPESPFRIDSLPFTHVANTTMSEHRNLDLYAGCAADQDESGPEYLYELRLESAASLWMGVFDRGEVDIDLHVLDSPDEAGCVERAHQSLEVDLAAGTYYLALDTFAGASERVGEYVLVVMER